MQKTSQRRPYLVHEAGNDTPRLVSATSQAQAIRHVVGSRFKAEAASGIEVARAMQAGVKLEEAGASGDLLDGAEG